MIIRRIHQWDEYLFSFILAVLADSCNPCICNPPTLTEQTWMSERKKKSSSDNRPRCCFPCGRTVLINLCLPPGWFAAGFSCDCLELPDVSMDSSVEQSTPVWIYTPGSWWQGRFRSCTIDFARHNSCQRCKWWQTNDGAELTVREITWTLCKATQQSSHTPVSSSLPFYCHTQSLPNR